MFIACIAVCGSDYDGKLYCDNLVEFGCKTLADAFKQCAELSKLTFKPSPFHDAFIMVKSGETIHYCKKVA